MTDSNTLTAPTDAVPTPAPTPVTQAVLFALLEEANQRFNALECHIAILVAEIDELKAA